MQNHHRHYLQSYYNLNKNRARLLISCQDKPGIVAAVSQFLYEHNANIVQSDQYTTDPEGGVFFMRVEFDIPNIEQVEAQLESDFLEVANAFQMDWRIAYARQIKRMAIFVSKQDHCLLELLWHWQAGDLPAEIPLVVSNHPDLQHIVEGMDIPYYHIPVTKENKPEAEKQQLQLLEEHQIDLVVLARYMQILSPNFVANYPNRIINIHHSFLPAFIGGRPYERAYARGVKLIGATSHYVTDDLDEGPIIEQDVARVSHRDNVDDLKRIGRTIERSVLSKAVNLHLEDRILVYGNKTVVF